MSINGCKKYYARILLTAAVLTQLLLFPDTSFAQSGVSQDLYYQQITTELQNQLQDVNEARSVRNGAGLAAALADPACKAAVVETSFIRLSDIDFEGLPVPVVLRRNFTLTALASGQESFPSIGLDAQGKVKLGPGVRLFFTKIVVEVSVLDMLQRGLGFLVASEPGSGANFALHNVGAVVGVSADATSYLNAWWGVLINRAAGYPGVQVARMTDAAPEGCSRDATVPAFQRCWTLHSIVEDGVLDVMVQQPSPGALEPEYVPKHFTLHMLRVDLLYGAPTDRIGVADVVSADGTSVNVTSGRQLAQALADPNVTKVNVLAHMINITNADFEGLSSVPVRVERNITITAPDGRWPVLELRAYRKVVMGAFVTLAFRAVVVKPAFTQTMLRYLHVSLFAPSSPGSHARLLLVDAALWLDLGFDGPYGIVWSTSLPRPPDSPGIQLINGDYLHNSDTCVNDSTLPPRQRCWAASGTFVDVQVPSLDVERYTDLTYPLYYTMGMFNTQYYFSEVLSEECLKQKDPVGCYLLQEAAAKAAAAGKPPSPPPSPPPVMAPSLQQQAASSKGGSSGSSTSLPIIIGAVVGGVGILFLLAGAAFFWAGVRRRREAAAADLKSSGDVNKGWSNGLPLRFLSSTTTLSPATTAATPTQPPSRISSRAAIGTSSGSGGASGGASAMTSHTGTGVLLLNAASPMAAPPSDAVRPSTAGVSSSGGTHEASGAATTTGSSSAGLSNALRRGPSPIGCRTPDRAEVSAAVTSANMRSSPLVVHHDSDAVIHSTPFRPDLDVAIQIKGDGGSAAEPDKAPWGGSQVQYTSTGTDGFEMTVPVFAVLGSAAGSSASAVGRSPLGASVGNGAPPSGESAAAAAAAVAAQSGSGAGGESSGKSPADTSSSSTVVQLLPTVLGKGAFGRVVEGLYRGQPVAVKLLLGIMEAAAGTKDELMLAFVQEVEILGRAEHPNIVKLMAACVVPPQLALVMERMEGSLERLLFGGQRSLAGETLQPQQEQKRGAGGVQNLLPLPKLLHIAIQIAQGIAYLHPTIIHRDLKPANVLINGGDGDCPVVKLSDFGLARMRVCTLPTKNSEAGTPAYMAPELFDVTNNIVSHRTDMYSFAVVLWVMLTGQHPWKDLNLVAIAFTVSRGKRLPLNDIDRQRCPPKLRKLITACWDADPLRRPAAAEALKELLLIQEQVAMGGTTSPRSDVTTAPLHAPPTALMPAPAPAAATALALGPSGAG